MKEILPGFFLITMILFKLFKATAQQGLPGVAVADVLYDLIT